MNTSLRDCHPGSCIKKQAQYLLVYSHRFPLSLSPRSLVHTHPDRHLNTQHSTAGHNSHQNHVRSRRRSRLRLNITGSIITTRLSG